LFLQDAARARLAGNTDIINAAGSGNFILARDQLIADPASAHTQGAL
jgi:hypothetical protein